MDEIFAPLAQRSERRRPPPSRAAPWLMIPHGKGKRKDQAFFNICKPKHRTCRKSIPEITGKTYWQRPSHQGWLVILSDQSSVPNCNFGDCFLWNPVTLESIQLPTLLHWLNKPNEYTICDSVLSSPPRSKSNDDDSMVFFLFKRIINGIHDHVLVFCSTGKVVDKQWRTKELRGIVNFHQLAVPSLIYIKGKLNVMGDNSHVEIEIQHGRDNDESCTLCIEPFIAMDHTFFPVIGGDLSTNRISYVESCDELFMIDFVYNIRADVVYSINISRLDSSLRAWKEVKSLGDHVLFLGQRTTASCSAAELGLIKGYLFYTLPEDQSLYIFDVEDSCTLPILPCLKLPTPWFSAEWMMMPTSTRVVDGRRRRIEDVLCINEKEDNIMDAEENKTSMNDGEKDTQGQKHNGRELEEATPWSNLKEDIVELIARYVHPVDYVHFRAVCKENRSLIPAVYRRSFSAGTIKSTYTFPWLVISKNNDTIYNIVDPVHNKKYLMNPPKLLVGATIRCSKGGWLLMSKGKKTIFFYDPFTRETIQLPDLPWSYKFTGISFTSVPTSSDCLVFAIGQLSENHVHIGSIARGNDVWRSHFYENTNFQSYMEFMPCLNNPVFYDGAFYCLDYNGILGVYNLGDGFTWKVFAMPQKLFHDVYPSFLVECNRELLLVDLGPLGKSIGIFRLDFSKMLWVKVESLGKYMLFISSTSCLSAMAPHSYMQNKIYFPRLHGERILYYSLDTGRYHSHGSQHSAKDFYDTREWLNCTWIEPNWSRTTDKELDWLSI